MEGVRASGQDQQGKANAKSPQDSGQPMPAMPQTLSPKQGAEAMVESGVNRHAQRIDVLFLKAIWGGIFLSYGGMLESIAGGNSAYVNQTYPGFQRVIEGLVFPVGLAMIVLSGTELLTSDMMFFFLAALKGKIPWWSVPYSYLVVFFGNLVGSLFFCGILVKYSALISSDAISNFITNAAHTRVIELEWHNLLCRGIGCNIMVCMSVYLASMASDLTGKVIGIWIPLSTFVVLQFEHVVADMFTIPMAIILRAPGITPGFYIWKTLLPALIGNIIGALLLGLSFYWMYLHDTSSPLVPHSHHNSRDEEMTVNGEASHQEKTGPLGRGFFGRPTKIQDVLSPKHHGMHEGFKNAGYDRSHF